MRAAVWHGGKDIRMEDLPKPTVGLEEALIKVKAVGICGSELHAYEGLSKRRVPPLVMGHEFAGVVEEVGERTTGIKLGDRVTMHPVVPCRVCEQCLSGRTNLCGARSHVGLDFPGAFAEYVKAPGRTFYKIPDSMSFEEATLAEPLSVGIHASGLANIRDGDVVLILGSGVIGLSCLIAARERRGTILVSDLVGSRLNFARSLGADAVIDASKADPPEEVRRKTAGRGVDTAIEAVGLEKTINQAISSVKPGGRVTIAGLLDEMIRVNILQVTLKEIQLNGSYGRTDDDFRKSLKILEEDAPTIRRLITHRFPLDHIGQAFERMSNERESAMKIVLIP
jgi:L-iditol 2-dehydrogenase